MEYYTAVKNDKLLIYVTIRMNLATGALSAGGCDWRTKHGGKEIPHVRGQGQKPGGPHARRAAAKRSYPTSEVRGSGQECQAPTAQNGQEELPKSEVRGSWPGATPCLRSGAAVERSYPTPPRPRQGAAAGRSYPKPEARGGGQEDQPHT